MRVQRVHIQHDLAMPVEQAFAKLGEHENLSALFPATITRVKDGDDGERNGVGSVRRLKIGPLPAFEETVTQVVPNERIVYRITKGSPLRGHEGVMTFSPRPGGGSHLDYEIRFGAAIPGLAPLIAASLGRSIRAGLAKLDAGA
jgi:uncharacterized protein YndB with AHSA1/START domain